jgi:hypothetical protein
MKGKIIYELDDDLRELADSFFIHHFQQQGGYLPYVFTEHGQYGEGIGSLMRGLWRIFRPAVISGAKAVGKQALRSAAGFAGDLASGADWREAGEERLREAGKNLGSKLVAKLSGQQGSGLRSPSYYNTYGMRTGLGQMGSGRRRNKMIHSAVKLFSFVPPSGERGHPVQATRRRGRKRKRLTSSGPAPKRRRTTGRKRRRTAAGRSTTARRRKQQRRKASGKKGKQRVRRGRVTRKQRGRKRKTQRQQLGSGFPSLGWL